MKRIILLLAIASIAMQVVAQSEYRGYHNHFGPRLEILQQELNLTETQVEQIKEIHEIKHTKLKANKAAGKRTSLEERKAFNEKEKELLLAILTPEQSEKLAVLEKQRDEKRHARFEDREKAKKELKEYYKKEVKPVLLAQRKKLEQQISEKDKQEIVALRTFTSNYKAEMKAKHKAKKEERKKHHYSNNTDDKREHFKRKHHDKKRGHHKFALTKQFKEQHPQEAGQLESLEKKYQADILRLLDEITDVTAEWKSKREASYHDEKEAHQKKHKNRKGSGKIKARGSNIWTPEQKDKYKAQQQKLKRIGFLLLDPTIDRPDSATTPFSGDKLHNTQVYPNPATNEQTLSFNIAKSGNVLVEIIDKKGKVVQQVHNGNMTNGPQTLNVDISSLNGYIFYYRITDSNGTSSTKFMTKN